MSEQTLTAFDAALAERDAATAREAALVGALGPLMPDSPTATDGTPLDRVPESALVDLTVLAGDLRRAQAALASPSDAAKALLERLDRAIAHGTDEESQKWTAEAHAKRAEDIAHGLQADLAAATAREAALVEALRAHGELLSLVRPNLSLSLTTWDRVEEVHNRGAAALASPSEAARALLERLRCAEADAARWRGLCEGLGAALDAWESWAAKQGPDEPATWPPFTQSRAARQALDAAKGGGR